MARGPIAAQTSRRAASLKAIWTPEALPAPVAAPPAPVDDPDKVAYLAFTSGTTGAPKCVMHSDNTLLANARDLVRDWGHGPHSGLLSLSPLSHHIAWVGVAQWLVAGCRVRHRRSAGRHVAARLARSRPAPPTSWACRRMRWTCWPSRRRAASRGWARSRCSTWRARRSRRRSPRLSSPRASSRRTSTA